MNARSINHSRAPKNARQNVLQFGPRGFHHEPRARRAPQGQVFLDVGEIGALYTYTYTYTHTHTYTHRQTGKQTDRQTDNAFVFAALLLSAVGVVAVAVVFASSLFVFVAFTTSH